MKKIPRGDCTLLDHSSIFIPSSVSIFFAIAIRNREDNVIRKFGKKKSIDAFNCSSRVAFDSPAQTHILCWKMREFKVVVLGSGGVGKLHYQLIKYYLSIWQICFLLRFFGLTFSLFFFLVPYVHVLSRREIGLNCTVCLRMFYREIWPDRRRLL